MSNKFITTYNGGFTILPNSFIMNPDISSEAKCLMLLLMQYAWNGKDEVFPSVETITYHLNWSNDRFQKYKKELVEKGFIEVTQAKSDTGQFKHNVYKLSPENEYSPHMDFPGTEKSAFNKTNNQSKKNLNLNKKEIEPEIPATESDLEIYEYWNKQTNLRTHKKLDEKTLKVIKKALSKYHIDDILDAIDHYNEVLGSNYYFDTSWPLYKFLKQENALPDFLEEGDKWTDYLRNKKNKNKKGNVHDESDLKGVIRPTKRRIDS